MTDDVLCDTVPLARVAFIHAGLADGLSLDELLEHQDVDAAAWGRAQPAFSRLFARGAKQGNEFALHVDALSESARKDWERKLPPLDQDITAFFDFERHYASSIDGLAFLSERGMRPSDLTRLERLWNSRFVADPALREQALACMAGPQGPCPEVRPEPPHIVAARVPRAARNPAEHAKLPLPFIEGDANLAAPPLSAPLPAPKKSGLEGTRDIGDLRSILASLPFARSAVPQPQVARTVPESVASPEQTPSVFVPAVPASRTPPVPAAAPPPYESAPPPAYVPAPPPAHVPAPPSVADLRGTSLAVDIPSRAALPFARGGVGSVSGAEAPPLSMARPEPARPKTPSDLRETSAVFFAPQSHALPFSQGTPAASPGVASPLTVEQYASLCVDLASDPPRAAETLRRYHLSPEQKDAVDAEWHARFAREPTAWFVWDRACKTYQAWVAGQKGKP